MTLPYAKNWIALKPTALDRSNQKGDDNGNTDNGNDRVVKRTSNSQSSTTTTSDDGDLEPRTPAAGVTVNDDTQKALSSSEKFRDAIHENDREAKISDPETEATTVLVEPVNFWQTRPVCQQEVSYPKEEERNQEWDERCN